MHDQTHSTGAQAAPAAFQARTHDLMGDRIMLLYADKDSYLEPGLYQSKWFDYRFLSPFQATARFIEIYADVARRIYARDIDYKAAETVRFPTVTDIVMGLEDTRPTKKTKNKAKPTTRASVSRTLLAGFWKARQVADSIGMPYDHFIEQALNARLKGWARSSVPQPSQLYNIKVIETVRAWWEEAKGSMFFYSDLPEFDPVAYEGAPVQKAHVEWMISLCMKRGPGAPEMLATLVNEGIVLGPVLGSLLPEEILEDVEEHLL